MFYHFSLSHHCFFSTSSASSLVLFRTKFTSTMASRKIKDDGTVDRMLVRLRNQFGCQPKPLRFNSAEVIALSKKAREILKSQPMLIELEPPVQIVGDTHGQFHDLLRLFDFCGDPMRTTYLFLGDYVDRGQFGLETLSLVLALKIKRPDTIWLLRGNHESGQINQMYGFYKEMCLRFGDTRGKTVWREITRTFDWLPASALVGEKILCMHGGLSPDLQSLDDIRKLPRPSDVTNYGLLCDLVWADPRNVPGWTEGGRGLSFYFGREQVKELCERLNVDLIVRAHELQTRGYRFFAGRRLLTIFSAPNYGFQGNAAAVLTVTADLECSFKLLKPDWNLPFIYKKQKKE